MTSTYPLHQSPLFKLSSRSRLAGLLRLSCGELRRLSAAAGSGYAEFQVEKSGGGSRSIENPRHKLKRTQARLAGLLARIEPPDHLYCPVKGRSYVGNAAAHAGSRVIRCLDVKTYFRSTSSRRVFWFFSSVMGCPRDIAGLLTEIATYKGHLPTGSPLSPILAYYANRDVWTSAAEVCEREGCKLTVYVDDVTISGPHVQEKLVWRVKQMISQAGLEYHKEKKYVDRPAEITGVIVGPGKLDVPNRQKFKSKLLSRRLQQAKDPVDQITLERKLSGLKGQIAQVISERDRLTPRTGG